MQAFTAVGTATAATAGALALTSGTTYYVTVRATNRVGLTATASSNGVTVDSTAPQAGSVLDGVAADIDFQGSVTRIDANWSGFTDAESGLVRYEWAIGTSAGGTNVQVFTDVGTATTASNTSLPLASGGIYYVTVRATNGAGLTTVVSSDGVKVDATPPSVGTVNDGAGPDIDTQLSTTALSANWSGFFDADSGVSGYEWAIGTVAGGTDVLPFTSVGTATSATRTGLSLLLGPTYYVTVRATNGAGLAGSATSDGVGLEVPPDATPPLAGIVNDGTGTDADAQQSTSSLSANWSGFGDPESGSRATSGRSGRRPAAPTCRASRWVGLSTSATANGLSLAYGTTCYVTVRATNGRGLTVTASSDGVLIVTADNTPPVAGTVSDGAGPDVDTQSSRTSLSANWSGFSDPGDRDRPLRLGDRDHARRRGRAGLHLVGTQTRATTAPSP